MIKRLPDSNGRPEVKGVNMEAASIPARPNEVGPEAGSREIFRHSLLVRLTHWTNALCLFILLMSGLQIFNAHPALYWGQKSDFGHPFVSLGARKNEAGALVGTTHVLGREFTTTGVLGVSAGVDGEPAERGFPGWITLPAGQDLATGRLWHFLAAWGFVLSLALYFAHGVFGGHFRRELAPSGEQLRHIGRSIRDHIHMRFPKGREAEQYNVLQKLTYLVVVLVVFPVMVLAGLTMSPGFDAAFPWILSFFGGRQSARTVHFLGAGALMAFFAVHIVLVLISGVWNNIRSMITGWYTIEPAGEPAGENHDLRK